MKVQLHCIFNIDEIEICVQYKIFQIIAIKDKKNCSININ